MPRLAQQIAEELERPTRKIADGVRERFAQHGDQFAALEPAVVTQMAMERQDYCTGTWNFTAASELRFHPPCCCWMNPPPALPAMTWRA